MPTYDFKCEQCFTAEKDVLVKEQTTEYRCRKCGGFMVRLFPASNFSLKGGGWYKDGYSSNKQVTEKPESD